MENGHLVDVNPATGEVIARVKCATAEDVAAAVAAARAAQPAWHAVPLAERIQRLKVACAALKAEEEGPGAAQRRKEGALSFFVASKSCRTTFHWATPAGNWPSSSHKRWGR